MNTEEANAWKRESLNKQQMASYAGKVMNDQHKSFSQVTQGSQIKVDLELLEKIQNEVEIRNNVAVVLENKQTKEEEKNEQ